MSVVVFLFLICASTPPLTADCARLAGTRAASPEGHLDLGRVPPSRLVYALGADGMTHLSDPDKERVRKALRRIEIQQKLRVDSFLVELPIGRDRLHRKLVARLDNHVTSAFVSASARDEVIWQVIGRTVAAMWCPLEASVARDLYWKVYNPLGDVYGPMEREVRNVLVARLVTDAIRDSSLGTVTYEELYEIAWSNVAANPTGEASRTLFAVVVYLGRSRFSEDELASFCTSVLGDSNPRCLDDPESRPTISKLCYSCAALKADQEFLHVLSEQATSSGVNGLAPDQSFLDHDAQALRALRF